MISTAFKLLITIVSACLINSAISIQEPTTPSKVPHSSKPAVRLDGQAPDIPPPRQRRQDPEPIFPTTESKDYRIVLEVCNRGTDRVNCWGYITNNLHGIAGARIPNSHATDGQGNVYIGTASLSKDKLASGVKTTWRMSFKDAQGNITSASLTLHIRFAVQGKPATNDEVVFKNIFIQTTAPL